MKIKSVLFVLCLLVAANVSVGETFTYPGEDPLFSISFPDDWIVDLDEDLLSSMPEDESIYLGLWAIADSDNLEDALDALDEVIEELVVEFEAGELEELEINDIQIFYVDGSGLDTEGNDVNVSAAIFSPDEEMICILFYYGTPAAESLHEDELVGILKSLELE